MTTKLLITLLMSTILAVGLVGYASAADYYVAKTGDDSDGLTWKTAWHTIGQGIGSCSGAPADTVNVALGTYVENITLKSYVTLQGGYDGETAIDGGKGGSVITLNSVTSVTIDGFTIQNGLAANGGGISCFDSSLTVANCTISNNKTDSQAGGGIWCWSGSLTVRNSNLIGNIAWTDAGAMNCNSCTATIDSCYISDNSAGAGGYGAGGGIRCYLSSPVITNCMISGNTAPANSSGGGVYCYTSSPTVRNCLITGNSAGGGGGIWCYYNSSPTITNCTIAANTGDSYGGAIGTYYSSKPKVINSIVWANSPPEFYVGAQRSAITVTYSCTQESWPGAGNIKADPLFDTTCPDGDYYLLAGSPCIDKGSQSASSAGLAGRTTQCSGALDGDKVDMGYHYEVAGMPTAYIDSILPNPATQGKGDVTFTGHGEDDGTIVAYEWTSSINGPLSDQPSFSKPAADLTVGTHTISFKVKDNDGNWSAYATAQLTIKRKTGKA